MQDLHFWIAQVEYQGQIRYTTILDLKPLSNTYYHNQHIFEMKYFLFAQFFLIAHRAAHRPRKREVRT